MENQINQCDGCREGLEIVDGLHRLNGKPYMACTRLRYQSEPASIQITLPLGKQALPVMVGKHKNGDITIQAGGSFVRIPAEYVLDLVPAILTAAGHMTT